jgi:hypothetical protein
MQGTDTKELSNKEEGEEEVQAMSQLLAHRAYFLHVTASYNTRTRAGKLFVDTLVPALLAPLLSRLPAPVQRLANLGPVVNELIVRAWDGDEACLQALETIKKALEQVERFLECCAQDKLDMLKAHEWFRCHNTASAHPDILLAQKLAGLLGPANKY